MTVQSTGGLVCAYEGRCYRASPTATIVKEGVNLSCLMEEAARKENFRQRVYLCQDFKDGKPWSMRPHHTFWSSGGKKYMGGEGEGLRSKDGKGEGQFWRPCQGGVQCFSHDYQDKNLFLEGNICVHVCFLSLNN